MRIVMVWKIETRDKTTTVIISTREKRKRMRPIVQDIDIGMRRQW